jgi:hypothetical protein
MPSLLSAPTKGIPERHRIVIAGSVVVATDYSFAEKGGPHLYLTAKAKRGRRSIRFMPRGRCPSFRSTSAWWCGVTRRGGHAAPWTGIVGPRYAQDLEILGVAAIAPAANIKNIFAMNVEVGKLFGAYVRDVVQPVLR